MSEGMTREQAIKWLKTFKGNTGMTELSQAFDVAIAALSAEPMRWIPVSERLPKQYKEVVVTDIETSDTYQSRYIGDGYWECDNGLFKNRIIAWMPLPAPYEGAKMESEDKK